MILIFLLLDVTNKQDCSFATQRLKNHNSKHKYEYTTSPFTNTAPRKKQKLHPNWSLQKPASHTQGLTFRSAKHTPRLPTSHAAAGTKHLPKCDGIDTSLHRCGPQHTHLSRATLAPRSRAARRRGRLPNPDLLSTYLCATQNCGTYPRVRRPRGESVKDSSVKLLLATSDVLPVGFSRKLHQFTKPFYYYFYRSENILKCLSSSHPIQDSKPARVSCNAGNFAPWLAKPARSYAPGQGVHFPPWLHILWRRMTTYFLSRKNFFLRLLIDIKRRV